MNPNWRPLLQGPQADQALRTVREIADALRNEPPGDRASRHASLAGGHAGEALFYTYLALHTSDESMADRAAELIDEAVEELASIPMAPSLYSGFPGVAWTMEHLQGRLFEAPGEEDGEQEDPFLEIDEALLAALERSPWPGEYDLIVGLSGLGVYALERLPRPTAAAMLERIVDRLAEIADVREDGVAWFTQPERLPEWQRELHPRGNYNLGVAHGLPGVVPILAGACAAGVAVERARPLLDNAVRFLLARRLEPGMSSCFDTTYAPWEEPSPSRLAWCYGDPGIAAALLATARAVGDPAWEREALDVGLRSAACPESQSMIRDAGLCHGAAGLGHLFNRMYQATGDERFGEAARFWIERALGYREPGERVAGFRAWEVNQATKIPGWRPDAGFLEGAAGIGLALLGAISDVEPAWDRVMLLSLKVPDGD
ncbi:MAG TPA: lanthionine synthetase C family protein [Thermoanaerobaculia bacterium]|nr:lanthionine synthetase C family protein [Thermoanaerobaculia bacterium]